jgi:hypothetical protein
MSSILLVYFAVIGLYKGNELLVKHSDKGNERRIKLSKGQVGYILNDPKR